MPKLRDLIREFFYHFPTPPSNSPLSGGSEKMASGSPLSGGNERMVSAAVRSQVDDSPGWTAQTGRPHERDFSEIQSLYEDSLTAFRKNPIAWRIIQTTTNYILVVNLQDIV